MASPKISIESRSDIGSNRVNKLRAEKMIPGVIYKSGDETKHIQVDSIEFAKLYREAGTSSIVELDLDGETYSVIIKDLQSHPVKNEYLHVDFQELDMDETIRMSVPVNLINRDNIKLQPSVLVQSIDEIEIECLPKDIPNDASIDVIDMDFDTAILVEDLDIAKNEDITIWTELDEVVCTLVEPSYDEEAEEALLSEDAEEVDMDVPLVSDEEDEEDEEESEE
ncbi:MAG TPA: 50S ribosomal protein L25 [Tissierellaceae bacterium]|nr:50S ribosomal protein L25 [Tissierellaceae bacterium]